MGGFTLLEVMFAMAIFTIGLLGLAFLMAVASRGTTHSRYMSMAATMANEKLEDLNRLSYANPSVVIPSNSTSVGSLSTDASGTPVSSAGTVYYYDDVQTSSSNGAVTEVRKGINNAGADCLEVFKYSPTSSTPTTDTCSTSATAPGVTADTIVFHRRWMIESPVTVNGVSVSGVRRISILVTLTTESAGPSVTFQMSTIRS